MKFHHARCAHYKESTAVKLREKWRSYLLKFDSCVLDEKAVAELMRGLYLGYLLKLPFELTCNYYHLSVLLATERPFNQLK